MYQCADVPIGICLAQGEMKMRKFENGEGIIKNALTPHFQIFKLPHFQIP
jgi:hypothetical protein